MRQKTVRETEHDGTSAFHFPAGFLWGAATSSHQVEGNNRWNDWWESEQSGILPYRSGEACRHYTLYEHDFDLAQAWGHNAHRFSIEWSRIEPEEGRWNDAAVAHYQDVVTALRARGMEPIVTLHHFTNPAWFARRGGWLQRDSPLLFSRYVQRVASSLKDVRYWLTINEPTVYAKRGFVAGDWPPFVKRSWLKAARVIRNMARAHVAAYRALHGPGWGNVRVGFAHSAPWIVPCDPTRPRDRTAAWLRDFLLNRAFFRLIDSPLGRGRSRRRPLDFVGLNYYARTVVRGGDGIAAWIGEECRLDHHPDRRAFSDIGWEIYPRGLAAVLVRFSSLGLPLMITENGLATADEELRRVFLREHLAAVAEALERGADVIGYLYWSLIDNFEWALGRQARFGLAEVDHRTQRRISRPAAAEYASVCRSNRLSPP
ncbi:MAG TPA: glycoside hydrolase family 1 protein [Gemmatimonadota bacterium]|nr:glycoside hydrolase family 1 protein [Gemmatimonadota bacterium]